MDETPKAKWYEENEPMPLPPGVAYVNELRGRADQAEADAERWKAEAGKAALEREELRRRVEELEAEKEADRAEIGRLHREILCRPTQVVAQVSVIPEDMLQGEMARGLEQAAEWLQNQVRLFVSYSAKERAIQELRAQAAGLRTKPPQVQDGPSDPDGPDLVHEGDK